MNRDLNWLTDKIVAFGWYFKGPVLRMTDLMVYPFQKGPKNRYFLLLLE